MTESPSNFSDQKAQKQSEERKDKNAEKAIPNKNCNSFLKKRFTEDIVETNNHQNQIIENPLTSGTHIQRKNNKRRAVD